MGQVTRVAYGVLDTLIGDGGADALLDRLCDAVADGASPDDVSRGMGVPWRIMRVWIGDDPGRQVMLDAAKKAYADRLGWEALEEARRADVETIAADKLRVDTYLKVAAKLDRAGWGDARDEGGGKGVTVVVQRGGVVALVDGMSQGAQSGVVVEQVVEI